MCCHKGKSEFLKSTQKFFSLTWKQLSMIRGVCVLFFFLLFLGNNCMGWKTELSTSICVMRPLEVEVDSGWDARGRGWNAPKTDVQLQHFTFPWNTGFALLVSWQGSLFNIWFILFLGVSELLEPGCSIFRSNRAFIGTCAFQAGICPFASKEKKRWSLYNDWWIPKSATEVWRPVAQDTS